MVKIERKQKHGFGSFGTMKLSILEGTIISSFFPEAEDMTIKEIIERIEDERSYERVNTALKSLVKKEIVKEKKVGKTLVYSLNLQNLYAESMGFKVDQPELKFPESCLKDLEAKIDNDTGVIVLQNPDFFGQVRDYTEFIKICHSNDILVASTVYISPLKLSSIAI